MIQINCTNCKTLLTIDDAFAGGVCRCRYCGTIQTVPKHLKDTGGSSGAVAQAAAGGSGPKTLYQNKRAGVAEGSGSGTGLDELANVVASSGLTSGRLQKPHRPADDASGRGGHPSPAATTGGNRKMMVLVAVGGTIIALLLGVIVFLAVRDKSGGGGETDNTGGGSGKVASGSPTFVGQAIQGNTVVYVLDRGAGALLSGKLELLKDAVLRSIETLGPEREFQVVFWSEGKDVEAYPGNRTALATKDEIAKCRKMLDNVFAMGQTKCSAAMDKAIKSNPDAIVLVPIKALLDEGFHPMVMKTRGGSKAKIYTFSIAQPELAEVLKKIANDTGGKYKDVAIQELR